MEVTSLQYSIDAAYKFHMHVSGGSASLDPSSAAKSNG